MALTYVVPMLKWFFFKEHRLTSRERHAKYYIDKVVSGRNNRKKGNYCHLITYSETNA